MFQNILKRGTHPLMKVFFSRQIDRVEVYNPKNNRNKNKNIGGKHLLIKTKKMLCQVLKCFKL